MTWVEIMFICPDLLCLKLSSALTWNNWKNSLKPPPPSHPNLIPNDKTTLNYPKKKQQISLKTQYHILYIIWNAGEIAI